MSSGNIVPKKSKVSVTSSEINLSAALHVTQVQTTEEDEPFYFYNGPPKTSKTDLVEEEPHRAALEDFVPRTPPFVAKISNLPMECNERELQKVFASFSIRSLTVPKKGKRPKGYALMELETREDLIQLLSLEKKCRGRLLYTTVYMDAEMPVKPGGSGDAPFTPRNSITPRTPSISGTVTSETDDISSHYSASISNLSEVESPRCSSSEMSFFTRDSPIKRTPSSLEDSERKMHIRLQKLAEFENAQTERFENSSPSDDPEAFNMAWSDILNEVKKSEEL
ncbi:hypothetical protein KR026_008939 [Drosophila bipectinata]|nr:hypothetical protein KR026_008939 [Drosophila bipectinata]